MARMGFIQDKLEIKFLLLYIASRLIEPVPFEAMQELAMIDDGVDFFDFSECMNDLVTSGHLTLSEDGLYAITEKGLRNGQICESSLPYSVRLAADKNITVFNQKLRRRAQIRSEITPRPNGTYTVSLAFCDRAGQPASEDGADGAQGGHGKGPCRPLPEEHRAALRERDQCAL